MQRPWVLAVVTGALLLVSRPARACDSSTCALLTRGQNGLLSSGQWRVDLSYRYADQGAPWAGGDSTEFVYRPKLFLEQGFVIPAFHQELGGRDNFLQVDVARGLGRRTTALMSLPLWTRRSYEMGHGGVLRQYTTNGLGDIVLGLRQGLGGVVLGVSLKMPTGRNDVGGDAGDTILDPTLQVGSGSWDVVTSMQHSRRALGVNWIGAGSYQWTTANGFGYRFGREAIASLAASRALGKRVTASAQAKLFHETRARYQGAAVSSTGATFVYVGPGLQVTGPDQLSLYGYALFAPYRYVNDAQLAPRFSATLGVSRTF
jgi:hypothetical protein